MSGFTQPDTQCAASRERIPRRHLLSYLLGQHETKGRLARIDLEDAAMRFGLSSSEVFEVASFYPALGEPAIDDQFDLSCWLSCSDAGETPDGWHCRGRCAKTWVFDSGQRQLERRINLPRVTAEAVIEAAKMWPRNLSIPGKWSRLPSSGQRPVLIVNADEGDPSTSKDRYLLETDPLGVLEGVLTAASAVNACEVIIYINHRYDTAIAALSRCLLLHAEACGPFSVSIERSGGAYICGEETALVASLEGKRAIPRERPYDLLRQGFLGLPTLVHNVESLYRLRALTSASEQQHASGLLDPAVEAISLSGRLARPGLRLMRWEDSLRDLIEACGGMREGHALRGVVVGGMLGSLVTGDLLDLPRPQLEAQGIHLGHGAVLAFSHRDDLRTIVLMMTRFHASESCGHCTPCRNGTAKAVSHIASGGLVHHLAELAFLMKEASACGLGRGAGRFLERCMTTFKESE